MNSLSKQQWAELKALSQMPDSDIDTSDIPEMSDFSGAQRGRFFKPIKKQVTIRLDADLLAWFRGLEGKYQSNINAALREYMDTHQ